MGSTARTERGLASKAHRDLETVTYTGNALRTQNSAAAAHAVVVDVSGCGIHPLTLLRVTMPHTLPALPYTAVPMMVSHNSTWFMLRLVPPICLHLGATNVVSSGICWGMDKRMSRPTPPGNQHFAPHTCTVHGGPNGTDTSWPRTKEATGG